MIKRLIVGFFLSLLVGFGGATCAIKTIAPTQYYELSNRFELWRAGARSFNFEGLRGLTQNYCKKNEPCSCVILIHGMGDSLLTWRRLLKTPAEQFKKPLKLIASDMPGFGGNRKPADPTEYRVKNLAALYSRYISANSTGCDNWTIVGNSFGGWVASWLAIDPPAVLKATHTKVLLLGSVGLKQDEALKQKSMKLETVDDLKDFQKRAYFKPREYPKEFWEQAVRHAHAGNTKQVRAAQTNEDYLDSSLKNWKFSTTYLWGEADRIVGRKTGESLARSQKLITFKTIPECGHMPQKECPEAVINALF